MGRMPLLGAGDDYLEPYRRSHARHGASFEVTLWASLESQQRRFEVLTEMCPLEGMRVLDAGCSRGDFAAFLVERGIRFESYVGVDGLPELIEHARARGLPGCEFHVGDFVREPALLALGKPDAVCISGALNTMGEKPMMRVLEAAWRSVRQALVFNFLSDRVGRGAAPQGGWARRQSTLRLLEWATGCTWCVAFRQDYFASGHDATILMRKPEFSGPVVVV
jgi:SAM-dependent methyltransferase